MFFLIFNWIAGGDVVKQTSLLRSGGPNDDSSHPTGVQEGCWKAQCQIKGSYRQFKVKPKSRRLRRIQAAPSSSFQEFPWVSYCFFLTPFLGKTRFINLVYGCCFLCFFLGGARSQEPSFSDNGVQDSKLPSISIWFTATLLASFRPWKPHLPPTSIFQTCWPTKITPNSKGTNKSSLTQLSSHVNQPKWSNQPTSKKWIQNGLVSHWDLKFDRSQEALEKSFQQVVPWISPKKMYRGGVFWRDDPGTSCEPQKKTPPQNFLGGFWFI